MSSLFDLHGKRALVTGSSRGIGLALAKGLADHGAKVILNGRTGDTLNQAQQQLLAAGHKAEIAAFDVSDHKETRQAVDRVEAERGPIDILINNAGMQRRGPLEDFPPEAWAMLLQTNVSSVFNAGQAVARHMIGRKAGKIVNIASVQSELARAGIAPYTATKGAVRNLTRGMAADWAQHNIQVNAVAPGYFKTELNRALVEDATFTAWLEGRTPARRWGNVDELVAAVIFLAAPGSSFVNGHTLYVDGGISISL